MSYSAYYNEIDKFAAAWLRELIKAGLIMDGEVDERSIHDVQPQDLRGFTRCHFFAGIGGWDYALQLADWPDDRPVWTGSCPCQPFSSAGKGLGTDDERHLWPEFFRLIRECGPATVFGEQVASKAGLGWLDGVFADMEGADYACGATDLCSAGINKPHIRQRLYWMADAEHLSAGAGGRSQQSESAQDRRGGLANSRARDCGLGDTIQQGPQGHAEHGGDGKKSEWFDTSTSGPVAATGCYDLIRCLEPTKEPGRYVEKWRRVEPGTLPLAHGVSGRVGRLRGYGNAIDPELAAQFIGAYMDINNPTHPGEAT